MVEIIKLLLAHPPFLLLLLNPNFFLKCLVIVYRFPLFQQRRVILLGTSISLAGDNVPPDIVLFNVLVVTPRIWTLAFLLSTGEKVVLHLILAVACKETPGVWTLSEIY